MQQQNSNKWKPFNMATPASRLKSVCSKSPIWMRGQAASTDAQTPPLPSSKPPRLEPDYEVIEFPGQKHSATLQSKGSLTKKCDLCGSKWAELQCDSCSSQAFCLSCDVMYHRHPNRQAHVRKRYVQSSNAKCDVQPPLPPKSELMSIPTPPPRRNRTIASRMTNKNQLMQNPISLATIQQGKKDGSFLGSLKRFVGSTRCLSQPSNTIRPDPKVGKNNHSWLKSHDQRASSKDSGYLEWDTQSRERAGSCSISNNNNVPLFSPMAQAQSMAQLNCAGCYHQSNWDWNRSQMSLNALPMHSPWLGHCHGSTMMFPPPLPCHMQPHHPYNEAMQRQAFRQPSSRARSCKMDETESEMSLFDGRYRRNMSSEVGRHSPFSTRSRRTVASESDDDDRFSKQSARFRMNSPRKQSPASSRKGFSKATMSKIKNSKYGEQRANRRDGTSSDSDDELTSEREQSKTSSDVRNEKYSDDSRRYDSSNYGSVADSRNQDRNPEIAERKPNNKFAKTILPDWECKHCTYLNHGDCKVCDICCKTSHLVTQVEEEMKKLSTAPEEGGAESKGIQMYDKTHQKGTDNKISKGTSPPPQSISTQTYETASEIAPKKRSMSFSDYEHWRAPNPSRNTDKSRYKVPASLKSDTDDSTGYSGLDISHSPRSVSTHNLRPASVNSLRHSPVLPDYLNSLSKKQGLEVVKLLREAEKRQFSAEDLSVALTKCGEANPIEWLRQNWNKMIDTVVSVTSEMSAQQPDKPIGVISTFEARDALRQTDGDIWSAANLCAQQRRNKCSEIMREGSFGYKDVITALNANHGDVESAKMHLNNNNAKTFSMNIWEPPQNNDDNMCASVAARNGKTTTIDLIKNFASNNLLKNSINRKFNETDSDQYISNINFLSENEHSKNVNHALLPTDKNINDKLKSKREESVQNGEREMNPEKDNFEIAINKNELIIHEADHNSLKYNIVRADVNCLQELESLALLVDHNLDNLVIGNNIMESYQTHEKETLSKNMKYINCFEKEQYDSELKENGFENARDYRPKSEINLENDQLHSNMILQNIEDNGSEADQLKSLISLENNEHKSKMSGENETDNTCDNNEHKSKMREENNTDSSLGNNEHISKIREENNTDNSLGKCEHISKMHEENNTDSSLGNSDHISKMCDENKTDNTFDYNEYKSKISLENASGHKLGDVQATPNINLENILRDIGSEDIKSNTSHRMKLDMSESKICSGSMSHNNSESFPLTSKICSGNMSDDYLESSPVTSKMCSGNMSNGYVESSPLTSEICSGNMSNDYSKSSPPTATTCSGNTSNNCSESSLLTSKICSGNISNDYSECTLPTSTICSGNMSNDYSECSLPTSTICSGNMSNDYSDSSLLTSNICSGNVRNDYSECSRLTSKIDLWDSCVEKNKLNGLDKTEKRLELENVLRNSEPSLERKQCFNDVESKKQSVSETLLDDVQYIDASSDEESIASQKICENAKNSNKKNDSICEKVCPQNKMAKKEVSSTNVTPVKKNYHANCVKSVNPDSWRYQRSKTTLNKCESNNIKKAFSTLELSKKRNSLKSTSSLDLTRGSGTLANKSKIPKLANGKLNISNKDLTAEIKSKRNQIEKSTVKQSKLNPPKNARLSVIKEHEKSEFLQYVVENLQKEIGLNKLLDSFISKKIGSNGKLEGKTTKNDVDSKTDVEKSNDENFDSKSDETHTVKCNELLEEGSVASLQQAKLVVKLMSMNFDKSSSVDASSHCENIETALAYLQKDCELCAGKFPIKQMISMLLCEHRCCVECCKRFFTLQISERSVSDCVCPFCKMPNIARLSADESVNYFSNLDVMLKAIVEPKIHEIFQTKLRDRGLAQDPNFRWCPKCSSGFIANPSQPQMQCPDCKSVSCVKCSQPWTEKHNEMSCEQYADWLREFGGDIRIEKHLEENGVVCPNCNTKFALVKGGCMHLTCTECKYEFCSDCRKPFAMGSECRVSDYCAKLGLHAHHPRNCLFYLRDKDPKQLQHLLAKNNISFHKEKVEGRFKCDVTIQKETENGFVDTTCGSPIEYYNLCRTHYIEYLAKLVKTHAIDPVSIFDLNEILQEIRRKGKPIPERVANVFEYQYRTQCIKIVEEQIPL